MYMIFNILTFCLNVISCVYIPIGSILTISDIGQDYHRIIDKTPATQSVRLDKVTRFVLWKINPSEKENNSINIVQAASRFYNMLASISSKQINTCTYRILLNVIKTVGLASQGHKVIAIFF